MNSTVGLTLLLLTLMCAAGATSAVWGYNIGRDALRGITQPDFRPTAKLAGNRSDGKSAQKTSEPGTIQLMPEEQILAKVKAQMAGQKPPAPQPTTAIAAKLPDEPLASPSPTPSTKATGLVGRFPLSTIASGVSLVILGARVENGSLLLDVQMQNKSDRLVQFLYSFLEVTDNQGRPVSAIVEDLPSDLAPDAAKVSGRISIPIALVEDASTLSLSLTDYPDQQIQLRLAGIPIPAAPSF